MAKRVNVSIPDDLYVKIDLYRDRLKISKICQKALEMAVVLEKAKEEFKKTGFVDGQKHAKKLSAEDVEKISEIFNGEGRYGRWGKIDRVTEIYDRFMDEKVELKRLGHVGNRDTISYYDFTIYDEDDIAEIYYEYREGWVNGLVGIAEQ